MLYNSGMVVYVEYVFIDNIIIDLLLLALARKTLKIQSRILILLIPSAVGATVATIMPLVSLGAGWLFLVRVTLGLVMVALSGKFRNFKEYIFCYYLFIFYTFLFGGGVAALFYAANIRYDMLTGINAANFPLGLSVLACIGLYFLTTKVVNKIYKRKELTSFLVNCSVRFDGESFLMRGFIDSGNRLVYKKTGSPVVLCSPSAAKKMFFAKNLPKIGEIDVNTVSGGAKIEIYKIDGIVIYRGDMPNIINNVVMGLSDFEFDRDGEYDLLLNPVLA